ncbi:MULTISPECIES: tRNA synthetase class II (G H P and S) [Protofrankia]|uniref:tRNA synthetase class II (G H P and S) n=1 Tax=Candidatus Protofrankia datiscae TaxID=2716812 RepID=F8B353_9ACTN|nr:MULTISPECIES: tRNA synthetase class II (G H P and S) [Protofrankia]AEH09966.1 tRNA synthetase class II (G H P and S) [Candidatus Protofrankia datiscae]
MSRTESHTGGSHTGGSHTGGSRTEHTTVPAGSPTAWSACDGLACLGGAATSLLRTLDDVFAGWGTARGAEPMTLPPLLPAAALRELDYFHNFPHLGSVVSGIRPDRLDHYGAGKAVVPIPAQDLSDATYLLPSATCYAGFLHFTGTELAGPATLVTMVSRCFRNEEHYDGLRRLWGFTMREIVCLGSREAVQAHLDNHHQEIAAFAACLGIELRRVPATDPFFQKDGSRAVMQLLAPVKEEYASRDGTAVASFNHHRNFFGERCAIRYAGRPAFTGCVAFGLERWLHVLDERFDGDLVAARDAVLKAGAVQ